MTPYEQSAAFAELVEAFAHGLRRPVITERPPELSATNLSRALAHVSKPLPHIGRTVPGAPPLNFLSWSTAGPAPTLTNPLAERTPQ